MRNIIRKILKEDKSTHTVTIGGVGFTVQNYISTDDVFLDTIDEKGIDMVVYERIVEELSLAGIKGVNADVYNTTGNRIVRVYTLRIPIDIQSIVALYFDTMVNNKNLFDRL